MINETTGEVSTMRVPVWMMKVSAGMLLVLSIGATSSIFVFFVWLIWITVILGNNIKETKKMRNEIRLMNNQAAMQREEVVKGVKEVKKAISDSTTGKEKSNE